MLAVSAAGIRPGDLAQFWGVIHAESQPSRATGRGLANFTPNAELSLILHCRLATLGVFTKYTQIYIICLKLLTAFLSSYVSRATVTADAAFIHVTDDDALTSRGCALCFCFFTLIIHYDNVIMLLTDSMVSHVEYDPMMFYCPQNVPC